MAEEQIDFGDDEYGGSQKQYQGNGAIPALADDDLMGEDDDYGDLYSDVNVGESFLQMQKSQAPSQPAGAVRITLQPQKIDAPIPRVGSGMPPGSNVPGNSVEQNYHNAGVVSNRQEMGSGGFSEGSSVQMKGVVQDNQVRNVGPTSVAPNVGSDPSFVPRKISFEPDPFLSSGNGGGPHSAQQFSGNQVNMNTNADHSMVNENQIHPSGENGNATLFVGELHWWTSDADLESVLSQYGRVKEIKFFDERASGKSKGYCQVEFYDSAAAFSCKERMNGYLFNGRACVVTFASPQSLKQMGASYANKNQAQPQAQPRRPLYDGGGRGGNMNFQNTDAGRNFGRGGSGRGGQGMPNRGPWGGPMRGRGGAAGKNNVGMGGVPFGPGLGGPGFGGPAGGMMHPQGMMGAGFDPTYGGRGGGYGAFQGPGFPGMLPSFPGVNMMGMAGVAPHVNPAFFGRGMGTNGFGMMGASGMDGPHAGMWTDTSMGGWGGEDQGRKTRESSYGGEDGGSEYGYGEANQEKGIRSNAASREKEPPAPEREWSESNDRRQRSEKGQDWDRPEREHKEHRYREEKDGYRDHRHRERGSGYDDDRDRGQSSSRPRSRSRAVPEDDHRSRSRDADYAKRRRLPSE